MKSESQTEVANKWMLRTSFAFLVFGLFFVSPLTDLLPIDFWVFVESWPGSKISRFYKITPEQPDHVSYFVVIGALFITIALFFFVIGRLKLPKR